MFCKTALATAVIVATLGVATTAVNAADSQSGNNGITQDDRGAPRWSVPAQYARPPWIQQHRRSAMREAEAL